jgi:hypothetical protein
MKARYNKVSNSFRKDIRAKVEEEFKEQSNNMTRRVFKLFCISLHQEFGFGKDRLNRLIAKVEEISGEREQDEVFWAHVDKYCKVLGLNFPDEDYERMDG